MYSFNGREVEMQNNSQCSIVKSNNYTSSFDEVKNCPIGKETGT
jgi:hypothetical protein